MTTEPEDRDRADQDNDGIVDPVTDDETPVGDTPEVHDTLSPRDIPKSHPAYEDVVRQAEADEPATSGT